jgi:hypothetical protein
VDLDLHVRAEHSPGRRHRERVAVAVVQALPDLRIGRVDERRATALAHVAVEGELADRQDTAADVGH